MKTTTRWVTAVVALVLAVFLPAGAAWAGAAPTTTTEHNATETFHDVLPCVGDATITITYNEVEHETLTPGGGVHATFTQAGTFVAVLDDGSGTATGHFQVWGNFNSQDGVNGNSTFTFNLHVAAGPGAGTNFHDNSHFTGPLDQALDPKVAFDKSHCV
jgi:hypothetical protein